MKELSDILGGLSGLSEPAVLVTVVAVQGSTYRRPGARMLVSSEMPGGRIGSISGGCLEDEVCRRAMFLTDRGPAVATYETGLDDGAGGGAGYTLGCGGRVTALIERVGPGTEYLRFVERHRSAGRECVVATVIGAEGDVGLHIGDRPLMLAEGGGEGGALTDPALTAEAAGALAAGRSRQVELEGGRVHLFVEVIPAPMHLFVFGAGHDADPVVKLATNLGWRVTVVARKPISVTRFGCGVEVVGMTEAPVRMAGPMVRRSAAIVMNHNYAQDSESVAELLRSNAAYVGILGPRHRTDAMLSDVASSRRFDEAGVAARMDLSRVHAPIGLDIGAETAEEVALAIIAEVQAFFAEREGGRLRDRDGAIHPPATGASVAGPVVNAACPLDTSS